MENAFTKVHDEERSNVIIRFPEHGNSDQALTDFGQSQALPTNMLGQAIVSDLTNAESKTYTNIGLDNTRRFSAYHVYVSYIRGKLTGYDIGYNSGYGAAISEIEEVSQMSAEIEEMKRDISDIKVSNARIEEKINHISDALSDIKTNAAKVPVINKEIEHIKDSVEKIEDKSKWWKSYILYPVIAGVVIFLLNTVVGKLIN